MLRIKKRYIIVAACALIAAMTLRPVPSPTKENTFVQTVQVKKVFEGPSYDVVFNLSDREDFPYINRGIQHFNIDVNEWNSKLAGESVEMTFIKHWTPLASNRSIAKIKLTSGEILFDRIS